MKRLKWIIPIALILGIWAYFQFNQSASVDSLKLVPANALYVIETDEPIANWKTFSDNDVWQSIKTHPSFIELTEEADYLDDLIADNPAIFKWFDKRSFVISAHMTTSTDYDFLFVVGLSNKAKSAVLMPSLEQLLKATGYKTTKNTFKEVDYLTGTDETGEQIHLAQIGNQLICSYSNKILLASITTATETSLIDQEHFQTVYKKVSQKGLCRLYVPYHQADALMRCYFTDGIDQVKSIGGMLEYSALDFEASEGFWTLDGYTTIDTSKKSILSALMASGQSENTVGDVLSNRVAWYVSLNYSSFNTFQSNIENLLGDNASYTNYNKHRKQIENLLGVSVEKDLLSWIGPEISVAQLRKNLAYDDSENAVFSIKTNDIELAKDRLNFVAKQVKKRTPALFKQIDYRSYQIQYLGIKGFFKLLFGEKFNKITKPYYTTIGDYVVFSNSPYTLIGLIEDYENQRTLSTTKYYQNYTSQSKESSLSIFVSPSNLYPVLMPMLDVTSRKSMQSSKPYFEGFESLGLNLIASGSVYKTHVFLLKTSNDHIVEQTNEDEFTKLYKLYASEYDINSAQFVLEWIEDGTYMRQFPGSKNIQIKAETTRGVLDGSYTEYYLSGEKKATGKYKMGRKKGTWKFYDESGDLIEKKKY